LSLTSASPASAPPQTREARAPSSLFAARTSWMTLVVAIAVRGVVGAGFQIVLLPVMKESAKFQPCTATGKLNAVMTPTTPRGLETCARESAGWSGGRRSDDAEKEEKFRKEKDHEPPSAGAEIAQTARRYLQYSSRVQPANEGVRTMNRREEGSKKKNARRGPFHQQSPALPPFLRSAPSPSRAQPVRPTRRPCPQSHHEFAAKCSPSSAPERSSTTGKPPCSPPAPCQRPPSSLCGLRRGPHPSLG
jgi:hypothetical protein